jgi:hypothetical protein
MDKLVSDAEPAHPAASPTQQPPCDDAAPLPQWRGLTGLLAVLAEQRRRRDGDNARLANDCGPANSNALDHGRTGETTKLGSSSQ